MIKYNKLKIFLLIFFITMFVSAAIFIPLVPSSFDNNNSVETIDNNPRVFFIPAIILSVHLCAMLKLNYIFSKYDKNMKNKDYEKADGILEKYMSRYKFMKVLKINLLLINGEKDLYIYNYNNSIIDISGRRFRYYAYLYEAYKIYFDLLESNKFDFSNIEKIKKVKHFQINYILCEALKLYNEKKFEESKYMAQTAILNSNSSEFLKYINTYIIYLCEKGLGQETTQSLNALKILSYNDYLKNHSSSLD